MRKIVLAGLTAGALGLPVSEAAAVDWTTIAPSWSSTSQCGGTQSLICASWSLKVSGNTYHLDLTNTSTNTNSVFRAIALGDGTTTTTWTVDPASFQSSGDWTLGNLSGTNNPWNGFGMLSIIFNASADQPNQDGLHDGESMWIEWSMTSDPANGTVTELGIHDLKGQVANGKWDSDKAVFTTVTPEPASIALLATGLVGVAGVGAARRRRHGR